MTSEGAFPSLSTRRLQLREIVASDAPALLAIHGDAEAMKWFGTDPLADLEAAERVIAGFANMRQLPSPGVRWGIVHADPARGSALIGTCGVFRWNRGWRTCLTGYELARHAQGRGYMTEALARDLRAGPSRPWPSSASRPRCIRRTRRRWRC